MLPPEVMALAKLHQVRQQRLALLTTQQTRKAWSRMSADILGSWFGVVGPLVIATVTQGQAEAARGAQDYVGSALDFQGANPDPAGTVPASAFAGYASGGQTLDFLLEHPAFEVQRLVSGGAAVADALGVGLHQLERMVATQIQDAARISTGVAMVNDRKVTGYIRVVSASACSRCIILAGRWYPYNAGFDRHPHCSCSSAPAKGHTDPQSPKALFDAMTPEQLRAAGWTKADIRAISDGADLYQVTNAHKSLRSVPIGGQQLKTTLEGATRRDLAGKRLGTGKGTTAVRLTPESLYAEAGRLGWDRDELIRQLTRFGYIR